MGGTLTCRVASQNQLRDFDALTVWPSILLSNVLYYAYTPPWLALLLLFVFQGPTLLLGADLKFFGRPLFPPRA